MIGRLVHKADFERVLATPPRSRSAHFAVHHVSGGPSAPGAGRSSAAAADLSTARGPVGTRPVDNLACQYWLGSVIPKRHARRSVTRNLLRRQLRLAMAAHVPALPPGLWLVRLRSPFERAQFPSAASDALRHAAGAELDRLFGRAGR